MLASLGGWLSGCTTGAERPASGVGRPVSAASRTSAPPTVDEAPTSSELSLIEARIGGRLGVFALDTATGRYLAHRPDERFAMCSTFKWLLAAVVLQQVDAGWLALDARLPYGPADLLDYAPRTREHVADGSMTVAALTHAAVTVSDNTAANLLLAKLGGPDAVTAFARSLGDAVTRLDRTEPSLNTNVPDDPRDTTSPRAMAELMKRVLFGDALSAPGRTQLLAWLRASETGRDSLRAGLPPDWNVGDKTGNGENNAVNDVAVAIPPGRAPVLIASYSTHSTLSRELVKAAHADVARSVTRALAPRM